LVQSRAIQGWFGLKKPLFEHLSRVYTLSGQGLNRHLADRGFRVVTCMEQTNATPSTNPPTPTAQVKGAKIGFAFSLIGAVLILARGLVRIVARRHSLFRRRNQAPATGKLSFQHNRRHSSSLSHRHNRGSLHDVQVHDCRGRRNRYRFLVAEHLRGQRLGNRLSVGFNRRNIRAVEKVAING
jgi:hypothetical protein